jgi:type III secretion protein J
MFKKLFVFCLLLGLTGCETNMNIVNEVEEREANEIIVFLASKGIPADKVPSPTSSSAGGGQVTAQLWSIAVPPARTTEAMAILNQNGLPRLKGVNLLDLFAKQGLMSSEKEESIRYQAGLASQLTNTIRKIDGVIDANVELSFPEQQTLPGAPGTQQQKVTASVYVKHQGILDDPNSHLVTKIKRLVSGSVTGLDINDVTVISDRSRYTDISMAQVMDELTPKSKEYVSIWSIVINKASLGTFRLIFFTLLILSIFFAVLAGWLIWKFYPIVRKEGGFKVLLNPLPIKPAESNPSENEENAPFSNEDNP